MKGRISERVEWFLKRWREYQRYPKGCRECKATGYTWEPNKHGFSIRRCVYCNPTGFGVEPFEQRPPQGD